MAILPNSLVKSFAKIVNDNSDDTNQNEVITHGTVKQMEEGYHVIMDGSVLTIPLPSTTDYKDGDRVVVSIIDHQATVTGNISAPSARQEVVEEVEGTANEALSAAGAAQDSADAALGAAGAAQDAADAALDAIGDITIGTPNLLMYTDFTNVNKFSVFGSGYIEKTTNGIRYYSINNAFGGIRFKLSHEGAIQNGVEYCLSFKYRANVSSLGGIFVVQKIAPNVQIQQTHITSGSLDLEKSTTAWNTFKCTFRHPEANARTSVYLLIPYINAEWIEIQDRSLMLQEGNTASPWEKAPEDIEELMEEAAKVATNYMEFIEDEGLVVGNMEEYVLGKNILISANSVDIRDGDNTYASFDESAVKFYDDDSNELAKFSKNEIVLTSPNTNKSLAINNNSVEILEGYDTVASFTKDRIEFAGTDPTYPYQNKVRMAIFAGGEVMNIDGSGLDTNIESGIKMNGKVTDIHSSREYDYTYRMNHVETATDIRSDNTQTQTKMELTASMFDKSKDDDHRFDIEVGNFSSSDGFTKTSNSTRLRNKNLVYITNVKQITFAAGYSVYTYCLDKNYQLIGTISWRTTYLQKHNFPEGTAFANFVFKDSINDTRNLYGKEYEVRNGNYVTPEDSGNIISKAGIRLEVAPPEMISDGDAKSKIIFDAESLERTANNNTLWEWKEGMSPAFVTSDYPIYLSNPISIQMSGIVLAWSRFDVSSGLVRNDNWYYTYIPKWHAILHSGNAIRISDAYNGLYKYIAVNDYSIEGILVNMEEWNTKENGTANGNAFNNSKFVLRAVLGV